MTTLILVWYASGWANMSLFALGNEKLVVRQATASLIMGPIFLALFCIVATFGLLLCDEEIWRKQPR